jgi:hypothetical protein
MVALYIYVDGIAKRIELFEDEKISVTSSVQDIADVSKAKTDFTQSFTIPASTTNNGIFKHWYESSIDGGFDHRIKYNGYIEIDTQTFREGAFALNDVKYKNGMLDAYSIVFYGKAKNIKDILKEDKLANLDFSSLNHSYTTTEVFGRITGGITSNVAYPLFANDRIYNYGGGGSNDITINAGAIKWNSLFPAIPLSQILLKISDKYNLDFTGAFLDYPQFSKLWMLFKNTETFAQKLTPLQVNFTSKTGGTNTEINLTTNEIGTQFTSGVNNNRRVQLQITTASTQPYDILIYKNGALHGTYAGVIGNSNDVFISHAITTQNVNDKYTIAIQGQAGFTFTSLLTYYRGFTSGTIFTASGTTQTIGSTIDIGSYAPDLKLIDLITGLIKMFNLVIIPIDETTYELIPLELYYNDGKYNDISANVISDEIELKKTSMYKNINFKYQKSENILNTKFDELFLSTRNFSYGDLAYEQIDSLESSTFSVELPFENAMYERKTDSDFQTITFKKSDLSNYVPKPLLMYDNGQQTGLSSPIKIDYNTGSYGSTDKYRRFSNDYNNGTILTLNWGEEISTWFLSSVSNGLYKRHYENYLGNIFNIKSRLVIVKCYFNPVQLINIKLNDRIIIRDKKYTINKLTTDLTSGETTLELLTDYRTGIVEIGNRYSLESFYEVDNTAQDIEVLLLRNVSPTISLGASAFGWISYLGAIYTEDTTVKVSISANTSGVQRVGYVGGKWEDELGNILDIEIPIIQNA